MRFDLVSITARRWALAGLLVLAPAAALAQPPSSQTAVPTVTAARTAGRIVIDGHLEEPDWQRVQPAAAFTQREPNEGQPATERTEVRILYGEDALYVGARMFDRSADQIARRLTRRDADMTGYADAITVILDPHHDHLTGVSFDISAAGSVRDATLNNDVETDASWDGVWEWAVSVDQAGWTAELRIPFSQLRFPASEHQTWGLHLIRYIKRLNEEDWWAFVPKKENARVSKAGHLTGLDGIQVRRHLDLLPYATAKANLNGTARAGDPFTGRTGGAGAGGLDAKWGVTSNMTVDATVNPDFGQVEVDPAVVNLSAFETFFEEKRPFFIEGAGAFQAFGRNGMTSSMSFNRANPTLFYSRRIGRQPQGEAAGEFVAMPAATTILAAGKLSGRTATGWTVNVLDALASGEWADTSNAGVRGRAQVEPFTNYGAARVRRDIDNRGGFGVLATSVTRDLHDPALAGQLATQATLAGADGHVFFDRRREYVLTGAFSLSRVDGSPGAIDRLERSSARYFQRPDATHLAEDPGARALGGWNLQLDFSRNNGNVRPSASFWAVSPGYEVNDAGFMTTADRSGMHTAIVWRKSTPDRLGRERQLILAKFYNWNFAGDTTCDGLYAAGVIVFRNYWMVQTGYVGILPAWDDRLTRGGPMMRGKAVSVIMTSAASDARKPVVLGLDSEIDRGADGSWTDSATASVTFKATPSLTVEAGPRLMRSFNVAQYVTTRQDPSAAGTYGARYVFGELDQTEVAMTTRVAWVLSPKTSLQIYAQPLLSTGRYGTFKEVARPRTFSFNRYGIDAGSIAFDAASGRYTVAPAPGASSFSFDNPDFNYKSLRVNGVFRWEFRPGSTLFVVWTQQREDGARAGRFALGPDLSSLASAPADNVLMVKVSYWFTR